MAARGFTVELNHAEVDRLLKGREVQADLTRRGAAIAAAAVNNARAAASGSDSGEPGEFTSEVRVGAHRARVTVRTGDVRAMYYEATDRVLTRALDAGR